MHELSIAYSIVKTASDSLPPGGSPPVREVHLRIGALSGIARDSLLFCYDIATHDTPLAGSKLVIVELPVVIHCAVCGEDRELPGVQRFRCPVCNTPSGDVRQGRELELDSLIVDEYSST